MCSFFTKLFIAVVLCNAVIAVAASPAATGKAADADASPAASAVSGKATDADAAAPGKTTDAGSSSTDNSSFDPLFLYGSKGVDLSRYSKGNPIDAGDYSVGIYLNDVYLFRDTLIFLASKSTENAKVCFTLPLLQHVGVNIEKLPKAAQSTIQTNADCLSFTEIIPGSSLRYDFSEEKLYLTMPQLLQTHTARGYIDPKFWDQGVDGYTFGYNFNIYHTSTSSSQTNLYLAMNDNTSIGGWHILANGNLSWNSQSGTTAQLTNMYVERAIPNLHAVMNEGYTYTSGELLSSVGFIGARLATDDRMYPDSLQGYAPVIHGVAQTNARVTVRQNGNLLSETTVAPGPFEITDIFPTGYGGDLNVTVTEANGNVQNFSVAFSSVPQLLRAGRTRFSATAGQVHQTGYAYKPGFGQGTIQRGINNLVTGYAGTTISPRYYSGLFGAAFNTKLGALAVDTTFARTSIANNDSSGYSLHASYAKMFSKSKTNFSAAAYRYSSKGYYDFTDLLTAQSVINKGFGSFSPYHARSNFSAGVNQQLGHRGGSIFVNATLVNYWALYAPQKQYQATYGNSYRQIHYNLSAGRSADALGHESTIWSAGVTIPLGGHKHPLSFTAQVSHIKGDTNGTATLSGTAGQDNALSYGVSYTTDSSSGVISSGGVNAQYQTPYASFTAAFGRSSNYTQYSAGMTGSVVAHAHGVSLAQYIGGNQAVAVLHVPGVKGANLPGYPGVRLDHWGYAVIPFLTPYRLNTVTFDPSKVSLDVSLENTNHQFAPYAGAIIMTEFKTTTGRSIFMRGVNDLGAALPFGAEVVSTSDGRSLGSVGQAGMILLRVENDTDDVIVKWGEGEQDHCNLHYAAPPRDKGSKNVYVRLGSVTCSGKPQHDKGLSNGQL